MSIEQKIVELTEAINKLTAAMVNAHSPVGTSPAIPAVVQQPIVPVVAAPTVQPVTPSMFGPATAPVATGFAAQATAPFSDSAGLVKYAMSVYQALGNEKGARIQGIIQQLGHENINSIRPDQFGQFFALVEQLKVAP